VSCHRRRPRIVSSGVHRSFSPRSGRREHVDRESPWHVEADRPQLAQDMVREQTDRAARRNELGRSRITTRSAPRICFGRFSRTNKSAQPTGPCDPSQLRPGSRRAPSKRITYKARRGAVAHAEQGFERYPAAYYGRSAGHRSRPAGSRAAPRRSSPCRPPPMATEGDSRTHPRFDESVHFGAGKMMSHLNMRPLYGYR
jgi:hypothetical protein